jgi:hypothetical protein
MGNTIPSQNISNSNIKSVKSNSNKQNVDELNDDKIFNTISDISNKLFLEYNNLYLKNDFCSKISIIYEKKLSQFNIKLLKTLHDKINGDQVDNELLMTIQYIPENDEKFEDSNNFFSENLRENFWSKNIKYNFNNLLNKNSDISKDQLGQLLKSSLYYINPEHVNKILNNLKKNTTNIEINKTKLNSGNKNQINNINKVNNSNQINNISQIGGYINRNNKSIKLFYNNFKKGGQKNNKKKYISKNNDDDNDNDEFEEDSESDEEINRIKEQSKDIMEERELPKEKYNRNVIREREQPKEKYNRNRNVIRERELPKEKYNRDVTREKEIELPKEKYNRDVTREKEIELPKEKYNRDVTREKEIELPKEKYNRNRNITEEKERELPKEKYNRNRDVTREKEIELPKEKYNRNRNITGEKESNQKQNNTEKYAELNSKYKKISTNGNSISTPISTPTNERKPVLNISDKELNKQFNKAIIKSTQLNIPSNKKDIEEEVVNKYLKFQVPALYKFPSPLCNNKEKCKLTKKQFCQAISENFIVRNNIIAAILTTIPYKDNDGKYVGGTCYQKFLNLNDCKVCVPYGYNDLKNKKLKDIIGKIIDKADYLTAEECKQNDGYFLELTENQKVTFKKILEDITPEKIQYRPSIQYNLYYVQLTNKLKNNYFSLLKSLITTLEQLEKTPVINNKTLNAISIETKNTIDKIYNLCHYYYVYAIISLINSELIIDNSSKNNILQNSVKSALSKSNISVNK